MSLALRHAISFRSELEVLYVEVPVPLQTVQSLLDAYESMLQTHSNVKIVVIGIDLARVARCDNNY